ncbi:concanavalin A-like lectin/glucanase [Lojkania enalia]|uniref:Concanavalin A-like lectin/glucanase n=1 Tax=Lojkania enalia TaxID=147567 RepID=A0A9P4KEV8_9PLEO|nr:concanavalin A-like lectin/glucanase [Didymosphaeria enalia]
MYITRKTMRTIAWSTLAFSAAQASYIIDNLSFGHKEGQPLSPNLRGVPHWATNGDGYNPEILSDRVILTPPYPGSRRGAMWTEDPLHHSGDWTAELSFRASGMERGSGNLQVWYVKDTQKDQTPPSLYTAPKFDGLVLVLDQYEGRGGSVRGFLNDGTIDFKSHHDLDTLSFGQCNYAYRNLGRISTLKFQQAHGIFEVLVDGIPCFSTDKVKLPEGYHFGITASSAENPDSFEIFKFTVSTTNAYTREEPNRQGYQPPVQQHDQQPMKQKPSDPKLAETQQMLEDVLAANIRSQDDRFADLHNRIQIINHRVNDIYDILQKLEQANTYQFNDIMSRIVPIDDRSSAMIRNVEKVERSTMEIQRDLESKDFKDMMNVLHNAIEDSHNALSRHIPVTMSHIVSQNRGPSMMSFLFIAVAIQVMVFGAYLLYKKRRNSAPKKYL